jgi:D-ribose pyranase
VPIDLKRWWHHLRAKSRSGKSRKRDDVKRRGLLHPELSRAVAGLGHGDLLVIADAGLPVPAGVLRIDLAFAAGRPPFLEVLEAVLEEMEVESVLLAEEIREVPPKDFYKQVLRYLESPSPVRYLPHEDFKRATENARVVVRTGEFTPYANVILQSGVVF